MRRFRLPLMVALAISMLAAAACGGDDLTIEKPPSELVLQQQQLPSELYERITNEPSRRGNGHLVAYETPTDVVITSSVVLLDSKAAAVDFARQEGERYLVEGYERGPNDRIGDFTITLSRVDLPGEGDDSSQGQLSHVVIVTRGRMASVLEVTGPDATLGAARILSDYVVTNADPDYPTPVIE